MRDCRDCDLHLVDFLYGELDGAERDRFAEHLRREPACGRAAESLAATEQAARRRTDDEPSPALLAGLKAEARKQAAEIRAGRGRPRSVVAAEPLAVPAGAPGWGGRAPRVPVWAAAAVVVLCAGASAWLWRRGSGEPEELRMASRVTAPREVGKKDAQEEAQEEQEEAQEEKEAQAGTGGGADFAPPPPPPAVAANRLDDRLARDEPGLAAGPAPEPAPAAPQKAERARESVPATLERRQAKAAAPPPAATATPVRQGFVEPPPADGEADGEVAAGVPAGEGTGGSMAGLGAPAASGDLDAAAVEGESSRVSQLIHAGNPAGARQALTAWRSRGVTPPAAVAQSRRPAGRAGARADAGAAAAASGLHSILATVEAVRDSDPESVRAAALAVALDLAAEPEVAPPALAAAVRLALSLGRIDAARAASERLATLDPARGREARAAVDRAARE